MLASEAGGKPAATCVATEAGRLASLQSHEAAERRALDCGPCPTAKQRCGQALERFAQWAHRFAAMFDTAAQRLAGHPL